MGKNNKPKGNKPNKPKKPGRDNNKPKKPGKENNKPKTPGKIVYSDPKLDISKLDPTSGMTNSSGDTWNQVLLDEINDAVAAGKTVYVTADKNNEYHFSEHSMDQAKTYAKRYDKDSNNYVNNGDVFSNSDKSVASPNNSKNLDLDTDSNIKYGSTMTEGAKEASNRFLASYDKGVSQDTSNPFNFIIDYADILGKLNDATNKAYDLKTKEAQRGLVDAENSAYANTNNAISELRKTLAGSAANNASKGSAAAVALQSMLGLGQQNNDLVTTGLQGLYDIADERASTLAQNAANAIETSNAGKSLQANASNSKYSSDSTMWSQVAAALSSLMSTTNTDYVNKIMNDATNKTNLKITEKETAAQKAIAALQAKAQVDAAAKAAR